jgi:hypothetical protein
LAGFNHPSDTDPDQIISNELKIMLYNIQEDVDHLDVAKVLIENDRYELLISMLQEDGFSFT